VSLRQTNLVCYKRVTDKHVKNVRHLFASRIYASLLENVMVETHLKQRLINYPPVPEYAVRRH
jgi:hypothetical protein